MAYSLTAMREEYQHLFNSCLIKPEKYPDIDACIDKIVANRARYEAIAAVSNIPWFFIGIIHNMECSGDFEGHLHNGDPLTERTVHVPKGYPKNGNPPFTWEESAIDALALQALDKWQDWSIEGMLYQLERYNGFGYRVKGILSPYLWSGSNQYSRGKFSADGMFNPDAVSKQIGAAVLLRRMSERQIAITGEIDTLSQIKKLGQSVPFNDTEYNPQAETLQQLLNGIGLHLRVDGKAGRLTSDAYKQVAGSYLNGDPKNSG